LQNQAITANFRSLLTTTAGNRGNDNDGEQYMSGADKRGSERKASLNLLDYVLLNDAGEPYNRAMARTLNVSEKGILLETHIEIPPGQILLITLGLDEDLVEIKGRVTHSECCRTDTEKCCAGIEFLEMDDNDRRVLRRYLRAFNDENGEA